MVILGFYFIGWLNLSKVKIVEYIFFSNLAKIKPDSSDKKIQSSGLLVSVFNTFYAIDLFLCPLKTSENVLFSDIFWG